MSKDLGVVGHVEYVWVKMSKVLGDIGHIVCVKWEMSKKDDVFGQ